MPHLNENALPTTSGASRQGGVDARAGPVVDGPCLVKGRPEPPSNRSERISFGSLSERALLPSQGRLNEAAPLPQVRSCRYVSL